MQTEPELELFEPLPKRFSVGLGQCQVIRGKVRWPENRLMGISLLRNNRQADSAELFPTADQGISEFTLKVPWHPEDAGQRHTLILKLNNQRNENEVIELGDIELVERLAGPIESGRKTGDQPLVAICMASYEPSIGQLERQLESILCQSYENWRLLISDDCSGESITEQMKALCKLDPRRIHLVLNQDNLGFYHNFERALGCVPENAELIAFADQDDEWYPEKLEVLVNSIRRDPNTMLAYSDMRIVSESGEIVSQTYWKNRKNEFRDFSTVYIANTVTGAASLFRREILEVALPFPVRTGESFHDHWIACVAMCQGKLEYVSRPLYDYIQYEDSVIGHCDFEANSVSARVNRASGLKKAFSSKPGSNWEMVYRSDYARLQLIADTLKLRLPEKAGNSTLNLLNGGGWTVVKLLKVYITGLLTGRTTNGAELSLIMGLMRGKP